MAENQPPRRNADGTVTITLAEPVVFGSERHAELTLRRPKARSLRRLALTISGDGARLALADMLEVLADCAGVSAEVVDELSVPDLMVCGGELLGFLPLGLATGRT